MEGQCLRWTSLQNKLILLRIDVEGAFEMGLDKKPIRNLRERHYPVDQKRLESSVAKRRATVSVHRQMTGNSK